MPAPATPPERALDRHLAGQAPRLVALLRRLVRVRTVNPPGADYDAMTRLLAAELSTLGLRTRRLAPPRALQRRLLPDGPPRWNVLGFWDAGAARTVHLNAHYDVVPVSGSWRHGDPFSGRVERGWIHGRGTADMKGAIASILLALHALRATGTRPRCNVEVSFTADEETDSALGAGWLVRSGRLRADYALVGEGGEGDTVCCGHNGVVWLEVTVHGRAAHGSTPERGVNALEHLAELVRALVRHRRELARRRFRAPDGRVLRPTLNIGGVFGPGEGGKINTVPALARFTLDRRVLPDEDHAAAERGLRLVLAEAARRLPGCRISVTKVSENAACHVDPAAPFFRAVQAGVARVRRRPAVASVSTGFNDMHFFAHHLGIPTVGYGPGGRDYHAIDERARVKDLVDSARIYAALLATFEG
jgi:succinyl-diaminopimelate desuccinylase